MMKLSSQFGDDGNRATEVLCLDSENLWRNEEFQRKLISSLATDGFQDPAKTAVEAIFSRKSPGDFEAFKNSVADCESFLSIDEVSALRDVVRHWAKIREHNYSAYTPADAEEYKVRYWPNNAKLRNTKWEYWEDIFEANIFAKHSRFITKDTPIISAGSCFAANISKQLQHWGYNYLVEMGRSGIGGKKGEFTTDPAACGNIYNAASMRQMIERAFGEWQPEKILVSRSPSFVDPFRALVDYDSMSGYFQKWEEHNAALRRAFQKAKVFILTLGMTEAWSFADTGLVTSTAPRRCDPTLFRHLSLSVEDNVRELVRISDLLRQYNPMLKVITTVSPVPLNATFHRDQHVVVANGASKAKLRVALDEICRLRPEQFIYFPSYEIVTSATRNPWEIDMRHVSDEAVRRVMQQFRRMYFIDQSELDILASTPIGERISQRRNYPVRVLQDYIVHPLKRRLGISGRPFFALFNRFR